MSINLPVQNLHSATAGNKPITLLPGQLAVNSGDLSVYTSDGTNIIELARDIFKGATAPASPIPGDVWYNTTTGVYSSWDGSIWLPTIYAGADVAPASTTSKTGFAAGSGTSGDAYTYASGFSFLKGQTNVTVDTITVTGLEPNQLIDIQDLNNAVNGGRFTFTNYSTDSTGKLTFTVMFSDYPESATGTAYNLNLKIGFVTSYVNTSVTTVAVFPQNVNYPTNTGSIATNWVSPSTSLTASGCILISTDNVIFVTGPLAINTGDKLYTKWAGGPGSGSCIDSVHGTTISGFLTDSDGAQSNIGSLTVDKIPEPFTFIDSTGVALSSVNTANRVTIAGINSYVYPFGVGTGNISINGSTFAAIPNAATATVYGENGATIDIQQTASGSFTTTTDLTLDVSGLTDTYSVTTVANTPAVATPTILSPVPGSTGITKTPTFVSSAYSPLNGALGHLNSDWEIYSDAALTTLVTSSMASGTDLTTWSPAGLSNNTEYWVRVKHRSSDPVASGWSPVAYYKTEEIIVNLTITEDLYRILVSDNLSTTFTFSTLANQCFIAHFGMDDICDPPQFISPTAANVKLLCNPRSDVRTKTTGEIYYERTGDVIIDSGGNSVGSSISSVKHYKNVVGAGQSIVLGLANSTGSFDIKLNGGKLKDSVLMMKVPLAFWTAPRQIVAQNIVSVGSGFDSTVTFTAPHSGYYLAFFSVDVASYGPIPGNSLPLRDPNYYPKLTARDVTTATDIVVSSNLPLVVPSTINAAGGIILHQIMFKCTAGNSIQVKSASSPKLVEHAGRFLTVIAFDA